MKSSPPKVFLTGAWRHLAMLNYEMYPAVLAPFVPVGTELDFWHGKTYASLVGFLFQDTRVRGIPVPCHQNFEEVNLRFYVRRKADDGWRRGVVFIKELVPRRTIAFIARYYFNENYIAMPMSHRIESAGEEIKSAAYFWQFGGRENFLKIITRGQPQPLVEGSLQQFITEHYWGYARQRNGSTMEYLVEHPPWRVWEAEAAELHCDVAGLYGPNFCEFLNQPVASAFLADGSAIKVHVGIQLKG